MKRISTLLLLLLICCYARAVNIKITDAGGYPNDSKWYNIATGLGHTASIVPVSTLDDTTFFAGTDVLIISSGVASYTTTEMATIQAFLQSGKSVYIQSEYLSSYSGNQAFAQIINNLGSSFSWSGTVSGGLFPNVSGTFSSTYDTVSSLPYFWYGCGATSTSCNVYPFLNYSGNQLGWIFTPLTSSYGRMITTSDQDWVGLSSSYTACVALMRNIVVHLADKTIGRYGGRGMLRPSTPTVSATPAVYCAGASATALTATKGSATDTLLWYTAAVGGTPSYTAPTPSSASAGTITYYVSAITDSGCEGSRAAIAVTFNALPAAPTVTSPIAYCSGAAASALSATGTNLLWYSTATGGTGSSTAPIPNTASAGTATYYVSQTSAATAGGCESPRVSITVNITSLPAAPTVTSPIAYCSGTTAGALSATGTNLLWYTAATGGTGSTTAPSTTTAGTYYVSQTTGCESPRASIVVNINSLPAAPTVTSPVAYCTGATASALTATGTNLKWYTAATGGTGSSTAPTPSSTTAGTYYVSQTTAAASGGCEGPRAAIAVNINALPAAPAVTSPLTYCSGVTASALTATGTNLLWYTAATGGTGSSTAPTPSTTTAGTYYVSQTSAATAGGCEGARAAIAVNINALPAAPAVTSPVAYCSGATASVLSATGTSLLWYTAATGGTGSTAAPTPSTTTGATYYVTQTSSVATGSCESPRAAIVVNVNALPAAPAVVSPLPLCIGSTASALSATGTNLKWYTTSTGGSSVSSVTPATTTLGTATYYVSQTTAAASGGCEGPRATLVVTINPLAVAPTVVSPLQRCLGDVPASLTATGTNLLWYTASTGGTGSATAPVPSTSTLASNTYYVSQTTAASAGSCEGPRAALTININPLPVVTISPVGAPDFAYCHHDSVTIKATALTATSLQWSRNLVLIPGATTSMLKVGTSAAYSITAKDIYGCTTVQTVNVFKDTLPQPSLSPTNLQICAGVTVTLYCSPATTGYTYQWFQDAAAMTTPLSSSTAIVGTAAAYKVRVTDIYGCIDTTNISNLSTYASVIKPSIVRYGQLLKVNNVYSTYQWYRNKTPISGATNLSYTMLYDGSYYATVSDVNGCTKNSDTLDVEKLSISNTQLQQMDLQIYPNPSQGKVVIACDIDVNVTVTDMTGRQLLQKDHAKEIDLSEFADGIYLFHISDTTGMQLRVEKINKLSAQH